jgi:hypothetical protein
MIGHASHFALFSGLSLVGLGSLAVQTSTTPGFMHAESVAGGGETRDHPHNAVRFTHPASSCRFLVGWFFLRIFSSRR